VKIIEYSPSLFEAVKEMDKVTSKDILNSLDAAKNRQ
jgi:1-phosphatidylinositol-4-phosphate 5-kinase